MQIFYAEMMEMLKAKRPEYFKQEERTITVYENGPFGQIPHKQKTAGSKAEDVLNTAHAMEIKYGREIAINYIKLVIKKGA